MPILLVDKPEGMTSHDVVNRIRKKCQTRQVGHTGTLDPIATGVLCVLYGRGVKASEYALYSSKKYRARLRFGIKTDTGDITGQITERNDAVPTFENVEAVLQSFRGKNYQTPPAFSALKKNGVKLCDAARRGETIEIDPREIEIFSLSASETDRQNEIILDVECSKGTYIRTLCEDIAEKCGTVGTMSALRRTAQCGFDISECHTLDEIESMSAEELKKASLPTERLFSDCRKLILPDFFCRLCRNGCEIYLKKLGGFAAGENELLRLYSADGIFLGVGRTGIYADGPAVKMEKMLEEN